MPKRDYSIELNDLIEQAERHGWKYIGNNTVRRMAEHETPEFAQTNGWWNGDTYASLEFLSFVFPRISGRAPKVVYGTSSCPWLSRQDISINYRHAVELLAQPIRLSQVHDR